MNSRFRIFMNETSFFLLWGWSSSSCMSVFSNLFYGHLNFKRTNQKRIVWMQTITEKCFMRIWMEKGSNHILSGFLVRYQVTYLCEFTVKWQWLWLWFWEMYEMQFLMRYTFILVYDEKRQKINEPAWGCQRCAILN